MLVQDYSVWTLLDYSVELEKPALSPLGVQRALPGIMEDWGGDAHKKIALAQKKASRIRFSSAAEPRVVGRAVFDDRERRRDKVWSV